MHAHSFEYEHDRDVFVEDVVLQVDPTLFHKNVTFRFPFMRRTTATNSASHKPNVLDRISSPSDRGLYNLLLRLGFDDDSVFAQLFLDKDDFLGAIDDEVPTRVDRALVETFHLLLGLVREHAFRAPEHDGKSADGDATPPNDVFSTNIVEINQNRRGICAVP